VNKPFFSIVVPTYNRATLIGKTIDTILTQDFDNFEIIVVDDGSKDHTDAEIAQYSDPRLTYFKKENGERGAARNFGRAKARGSYINFFDSDDLMYPHHLSTALELISRYTSPEFFHLGYDFKDPDLTITKRVNTFDDSVRERALFDNVLSCNGVFVRADIAARFPFEEDRRMASAEDWELWIRLLSRYTLHYSNVITTSVVSHELRSIRTIPTEKIITRDLLLINCLKKDVEVRRCYGKKFGSFVAGRYTFIMLCLSEDRKRGSVARWAIQAVRVYPRILFDRRFLAAIKNTLTP
jgi:glycosyltransferase involved in cell wall biosynthesis